jgi:hypothetical protein
VNSFAAMISVVLVLLLATGGCRAQRPPVTVTAQQCAGLADCNQAGDCVPDLLRAGAKCDCYYGFSGSRCEVGPRNLPPNTPQQAVVAGGKVEQCVSFFFLFFFPFLFR